MAQKKIEVGRKVQKANQKLPQETKELLLSLSMAERRAYAKRLVEQGWTSKAVAHVLSVTRQAVNLYLAKVNAEAEAKVKELPIPELPSKAIYKSELVEAPAEALEKLKELHKVAKLVRGRSQKHRTEADDFTRLAWEQVSSGVTIYSLAKSLGVTPSSLQFRFVRYGYKTTNGKSGAYAKIQYDKGAKENG